MQFGFIVTTGDPRTVADLAAEAEQAGWDGVFYYDAIAIGDAPMYDPWVVMAAMAMRTERVRLGAIVTPPSRRRPWKLAREAMTLDRLSNGRLVLPVGLGALDDAGFGNVGEPTDARTRAELLAERDSGDALIRHDLAGRGLAEELVEAALAELEPEHVRAARVLQRRGSNLKTARYLARKGFSEESIGDPVAEWPPPAVR